MMQARDKASLHWYNVMGDCREVVCPSPLCYAPLEREMVEEAAHNKKRGRGKEGLDRQVGGRGAQQLPLLSPEDDGDFCRVSAPSLAQTGDFSLQADRILPLLLE